MVVEGQPDRWGLGEKNPLLASCSGACVCYSSQSWLSLPSDSGCWSHSQLAGDAITSRTTKPSQRRHKANCGEHHARDLLYTTNSSKDSQHVIAYHKGTITWSIYYARGRWLPDSLTAQCKLKFNTSQASQINSSYCFRGCTGPWVNR